MSLSLIYARSLNGCIGNAGRVPWHLPDDFSHFQRTTMGSPIIMGRKTYEDHDGLLPGRLNIVVSRQADYQPADGIVLCDSLEAAIDRVLKDANSIFIIGGVDLLVAGFDQASTVYETVVDVEINGDTLLPLFDFSGWHTSLLMEHAPDELHAFGFSVFKHERIQ